MTTECVGPEEFLDYFEGILSQERDAEIEAHLDLCSACQTLARRTLAFSASWDEWAAPSGAEAVSPATLVAALVKVEETAPAWRERLARWRERWGGRAGAAARIIFEAPGAAARVLTEGLGALILPPSAGGWAQAAIRTRGAVPVRGTTPAGVPEPGGVQIEVDAVGADLVVRVSGLQAAPRPPLVLLIPTGAGAAPHVAALEVLRDGGGEFAARFEGVGPGDYIVVVEPSERGDA
jgi:anti-sigma factor RsiW